MTCSWRIFSGRPAISRPRRCGGETRCWSASARRRTSRFLASRPGTWRGPMATRIQQAATPLPVRRFSVDEYHRMIQTGILTDEDRVELLEGWIVLKTPRTPGHDAVIAMIHNQPFGPRLPK